MDEQFSQLTVLADKNHSPVFKSWSILPSNFHRPQRICSNMTEKFLVSWQNPVVIGRGDCLQNEQRFSWQDIDKF